MRTIIFGLFSYVTVGCVVVADDAPQSSNGSSSGGETTTVVVERDGGESTQSNSNGSGSTASTGDESTAQGPTTTRRAGDPELRDDRRDNIDDTRDRRLIREIVAQWKRAVADGNRRVEQHADNRIAAWLQREIQEDLREVDENRGEIAASRNERDATAATGDRRATNEDTRDLNDDRRDYEVARRDLQVTREIAIRLRRMQREFDRGTATRAQYAQKERLLDRLVVIASRELQTNRNETMEDRTENRE